MEKSESYVRARGLISCAKKWNELYERNEKGEHVPVLNSDGLYEYRPANPEQVAKEIKETLSGMDAETREAVFGEISKVAEEAQTQIDENGGSWLCQGGETMKACNALNSFKAFVEKQEAETTDAPSE